MHRREAILQTLSQKYSSSFAAWKELQMKNSVSDREGNIFVLSSLSLSEYQHILLLLTVH